MTSETLSPLVGFWRDVQQPDILWQASVLLLCLVLAWFANRMVRERAPVAGRVWQIGQGGLRRITFPLAALLLVLVARPLVEHWIHAQLLTLAIPLLGSLAIIRTVFYVLRHTFSQSGWLGPFERSFSLLVWGVVALHILGVLPDVVAFLESIGFSVGKQKLNLWLLLQGAATVLTTVLVALWVGGLIESRLMASTGLDANLRVVSARLARALLLVLAVLIGLPLVGIDLTTLSVFGGALGVGIGFGLQKIASSYVSGFIILLDRSIRLGNVIAVGNDRGQVTQITTRYTVLRNTTGVEVIVPNEVLIGSVVLNESLTDPRIRVALSVQVGYDSDIELAMRIMRDAAMAQPRVLADPPVNVFLTSFADSGINLELGIWIGDSQEGTLQLRSDINQTILREFRVAGIEIPYPQRELRIVGERAA